MKALIIIAILITILSIGISFYRSRNWKKLLISLGLFTIILTLSGLGNMTRSIVPLFIAHFVLILFAWGALILYILREKLYWQVIISPIVTIIIFLILERLIGSGGY